MYNIRLGEGQATTQQNEEDVDLEDEEMTSRVMNMMQNIEESDEENSDRRVNRIIADDDDDEDNELISQLLSTNQI